METPRWQPYRCLLPNTGGHDYFVGDIHGAFERLHATLVGLDFDDQRDRLICVGDLVDRGAGSLEALAWLEQPWFHSVRGNHEDLYLGWRARRHDRAAQEKYEHDGYFVNGGRWVTDVEEDDHAALEAALIELPYFLSVATTQGRIIGVVHAELPEGARWPDILTMPAGREQRMVMTWGRRVWSLLQNCAETEPWFDGLDALVVGHSGVERPQACGNTLFLDTCGWKADGHFTVLRSDEVFAIVDGLDTTAG